MKLIHAIVQAEDTSSVCEALSNAGYYFTKIKSMGGFLERGNTVIMMGVEEEKLEDALEIIKNNGEKRSVKMPVVPTTIVPGYVPPLVDVNIGGATVFITDVERFLKM